MIWVNETIIQGDLATYIRNDQGSWLYEVMRIQDGCPIFLIEHLDRLESGIVNSKFPRIFTQDKLISGIFDLINKEKISFGNIRIQLNKPTGEVLIGEIPHHYPTIDQIAQGVIVGILDKERSQPNIKSWNPEVRLSADDLIQNSSAYEVLLVNSNNQITEGSRSNLFGITKDQIITPPLHQVLPGITRKIVQDLCKSTGIIAHERVIFLEQLKNFDALFISGTSPGILPIKKVNDIEFDPNHRLIQALKTAYNLAIEQNIQQSVKKYYKR